MKSVAEVHIWGVDLDAAPDPFFSSLSAKESDRARRFHFASHRDRFVVAHGVLRRILSTFVDRAAAEIAFEYGAFGKPMLPNGATPHFNISRSNNQAMIAVCEDHPVGIDIESVRPLELTRLAVIVFNERERGQMNSWSDKEQVHAFFRGWSGKEAYFKATGAGLSARLHDVTVDLGEHSFRILDIKDGDARGWSVQAIPTPKGFSGALAVPCQDAAVVWHEEIPQDDS